MNKIAPNKIPRVNTMQVAFKQMVLATGPLSIASYNVLIRKTSPIIWKHAHKSVCKKSSALKRTISSKDEI